MTVEHVLEHALEHHPLLRARQHEVEAARARLVTAGLLPNPQFVLDTESPVDEVGPTIMSTRVTFTVPTGRKRRLRQVAAEAGIQRTRYSLARETELVLAEAADAALEVLYLQELAEVQAELGELAAKAASLEKARFQGGALPYRLAIRAELDAATLELSRLDTQGRLALARIRLSRAVGLRPSHPVTVQGRLAVQPVPAVPLEALLVEAEASRPDLAESRATVLESQRELDLARAEARPDIVFGPRVHDVLSDTGDRVGARVAVDVPLFDRNQGVIAERAAQVRTGCALLDVTEISTLSDVAAAYAEIQAIQARLGYHEAHIRPMLAQTEATIRDASVEKVLDPGRAAELLERLAKMRLEELDLRYRHASLRTRLEILLGRPLDASPGGG